MAALWTVLADGQSQTVTLHEQGSGLWLTPQEFGAVTGWQVKEQTLCRDDRCLPLSLNAHLQDAEGNIDLAAFAKLQHVPGDHANGLLVIRNEHRSFAAPILGHRRPGDRSFASRGRRAVARRFNRTAGGWKQEPKS